MNFTEETRRKGYRAAFVFIAFVVLLRGGLVAHAIYRDQPKDYDRWYKVARWCLQGRPLADPSGVEMLNLPEDDPNKPLVQYRLPPAFAVYIAPLGLLPYHVYVAVWYLLNIGCTVAAVALALKLVSGRWLPWSPLVLIVPVLGVLPFVWDDLHAGNTNLQLLALLMLGAYLASKHRPLWGGLAIGWAISMKLFPVPILAPLFAQRRWKILAATIIGSLLLTFVAPGIFRGFERNLRESGWWYARVIEPYLQSKQKRQWDRESVSVKNMSLYAGISRFTRPVDVLSGNVGRPGDWEGKKLYVNVVSLPQKAADLIFLGFVAACGLAIGVVSFFGKRPKHDLTPAVDFAIGMTFILIATPIAWAYFYALLLLPFVVAAYVSETYPAHPLGRLCRWACILGVLPMMLSPAPPLAAVGLAGWLTLGWLAVMLILRRRLEELPPRPVLSTAKEKPSADSPEAGSAPVASSHS